jgi:peroxiredoxin
MQLISFIVMLIVIGYSASGQDDIGACTRNMFIKADSLNKAGRDPFEAWKECALNKKVPSFNLVTLNGDTINSKQIEGKIVVLNFWFIDCHPCVAEMPGLNKLVAEYKNNTVEFLAITWETAKRVREEFLAKYKLDFKIIPEARRYIDKAIGSGYPTTYILDTKGIIREAWNGGSIDNKAGEIYYGKAKPVIDRLLKVQ